MSVARMFISSVNCSPFGQDFRHYYSKRHSFNTMLPIPIVYSLVCAPLSSPPNNQAPLKASFCRSNRMSSPPGTPEGVTLSRLQVFPISFLQLRVLQLIGIGKGRPVLLDRALGVWSWRIRGCFPEALPASLKNIWLALISRGNPLLRNFNIKWKEPSRVPSLHFGSPLFEFRDSVISR